MKVQILKFDGFDWSGGNINKAQKHGVKIDEIEKFFEKELLVLPDEKHSQIEDRFIAVGPIRHDRTMFVSFTFRKKRGKILIRPISARYTHKRESEIYENLKKTIQKEY